MVGPTYYRDFKLLIPCSEYDIDVIVQPVSHHILDYFKGGQCEFYLQCQLRSKERIRENVTINQFNKVTNLHNFGATTGGTAVAGVAHPGGNTATAGPTVDATTAATATMQTMMEAIQRMQLQHEQQQQQQQRYQQQLQTQVREQQEYQERMRRDFEEQQERMQRERMEHQARALRGNRPAYATPINNRVGAGEHDSTSFATARRFASDMLQRANNTQRPMSVQPAVDATVLPDSTDSDLFSDGVL